MATYLIGDVQGCYDELCHLLDTIHFDSTRDQLGFCGDLVNRGPQSLRVLQFIRGLPQAFTILGNHDIYLLALYYNAFAKIPVAHTMQELLEHPEIDDIISWLAQQPLCHYDSNLNYCLVHAGIPAQWNVFQAQQYATEVSVAIQSADAKQVLAGLWGNDPNYWDEKSPHTERLRYITNALTRLRFCNELGHLDLISKGARCNRPDLYKPWFLYRHNDPCDIYFGHWAALGGQVDSSSCFGLDTGCVWGYELTAMRVEDKKRFSVPAKMYIHK